MKNKVEIKVKKKLGRPKLKDSGTGYSKPKYPEVAPVKFLGYCKKCDGMITRKDLVSIRVSVCPTCGKRSGLNKLVKVKKEVKEKHSSKREYLSDILQVDYKAHSNGDNHGTLDHVKNIKIAE